MSSPSIDRPILIYHNDDLLQFTISNLNDVPALKPTWLIFNGLTVGLASGALLSAIVFSTGHPIAAIATFFFITIAFTHILNKINFRNHDNTRCELIEISRSRKNLIIQKEYLLNSRRNECFIYDKSISNIIFSPPGCRRSNLNGREQISWGPSTITIQMSIENHQLIFSDNYSISCDSEINQHLSGDDLQWMAEEICDFLTLKLVIGAPTEAPLTPDEVQAYIDWFSDVG